MKNHRIVVLLVLVVLFAGFISACGESEDAGVKRDRERTSQAMDQYTNQVPVPLYPFPWVRYVVKQILDAQQAGISTFSYVYNPFLGKMLWSCTSVGYPIPGGTQMTNPDQALELDGEVAVTIPQAEPSGVYSPSSATATMVLCVDVEGRAYVRYEEDYVHTVPFPIKIVDGVEVPLEGYDPSFTIDTTVTE